MKKTFFYIEKSVTLFVTLTFFIIFITSCQEEDPIPDPIPDVTCNYVQWTGTVDCGTGKYPISNTICCPSGSPFSFNGNYCYKTCLDAYNVANGATIYRYNDGNTGSSSSSSSSSSSGSGVCNYVQWSGTADCGSGFYPYSNDKCCPTGSPFSFNGNYCYTTCEAAKNAANGATVYRYNDTNTGSSSSSSSSSGGTVTTGTLIVWNSKSTPCPAGSGTVVDVYIAGSYAGGIGSYCTSAPSCTASSNCAIKRTLDPGNYSVSAKCGTTTWPVGTATIVKGGCFQIQLQ